MKLVCNSTLKSNMPRFYTLMTASGSVVTLISPLIKCSPLPEIPFSTSSATYITPSPKLLQYVLENVSITFSHLSPLLTTSSTINSCKVVSLIMPWLAAHTTSVINNLLTTNLLSPTNHSMRKYSTILWPHRTSPSPKLDSRSLILASCHTRFAN